MPGSQFGRGWRVALLALMVAVLPACGGGGSGGGEDADLSTREPLPTLVQDILPTGERLDLRDRHYFPAQAGDSWTYDLVRNGVTTPGAASLSVTSASGDDAWLSETVQGETTTGHWRRTAAGVVSVAALEGSGPATAVALVGDLLEFPEPFYAVGAERQFIRQGDWGEDLDGDGRTESFRLEMTQVLVGFETVSLPLGSAEAAHFRTTLRLTMTPSQVANAPVTAITTEDSWWAPGIGQVRVDRSAVDGQGMVLEPAYSLRVSMATVGGTVQFVPRPDGTVVQLVLPHRALVFDRSRGVYYASVPASAGTHGNSIATIDAATGEIGYSAPVGADPGALAVAADGSALYVALDGSGDILRLALPTMQEVYRTRLPAPAFWGQLLAQRVAVSPVDAAAVAVSLRRVGISPQHGGVALIRNGALQPQMTQESTGSNLIAFATDGTWLYGYNNESSEAGLRRIELLADGLIERSVVATTEGSSSRMLDASMLGPVLGDAQYRGSDLAMMVRVNAPGGSCRVPSTPGRLVCLQEPASPSTVVGHLVVADAASGATLATPAYTLGNTPFGGTELVPGPAGQTALRFNFDYDNGPAQNIWLFTSPQLP